jgi:3-methylcrotonyl-CoA carboxylase alpha subunit
MFTTILIANRGEIACRVAAPARRMGIRTVAVYSDADVQALHVRQCDMAVPIGGSAATDSYLRGDAVIAAALASGAQAVHPGYGFLSENADFAQACLDAGLVFIGPPPAAIRAMGLKAASKQLMERAGVPLVPGYHGADQDPALLQREADRMGYPVLIKASAGGGGKGMRIVEAPGDFAAALASCQREAVSSFGNGAVLIEKYVQRPRHIEVQVFGDRHGNYVHLFERDCSVQRRHQKVLEEAPAPGMTEGLRGQMGAAAVAAARAVAYVGAGTVEFIVEQTGYDQPDSMQFFFMEMNTRLQVEHPVTEAITGLDLVEWQLRVASGEPLPLRQDQLQISGHAIEARICAEDPEKNFLPAVGPLAVFRTPDCARFAAGPVRMDSGVGAGDNISPFYDPMLAKLIVHGSSREQALARMDAALAQLHIAGLATNVQFLRHVIATPAFAGAALDTALIARESDRIFGQDAVGAQRAVLSAVAQLLVGERALETADPFSRRDGWQSHGETLRCVDWVYADAPLASTLHYAHDGRCFVQLDDETHALQVEQGDAPFALRIRWGTQEWRADVDALKGVAHVFMPQGAASIRRADPLAQYQAEPAHGGLHAPMPGKVLQVLVGVGERVVAGQTLALMEAMKMEHSIRAPFAGVVAELLYASGEQVAEGAALMRLDPA